MKRLDIVLSDSDSRVLIDSVESSIRLEYGERSHYRHITREEEAGYLKSIEEVQRLHKALKEILA